jgi:hypothetical protein
MTNRAAYASSVKYQPFRSSFVVMADSIILGWG